MEFFIENELSLFLNIPWRLSFVNNKTFQGLTSTSSQVKHCFGDVKLVHFECRSQATTLLELRNFWLCKNTTYLWMILNRKKYNFDLNLSVLVCLAQDEKPHHDVFRLSKPCTRVPPMTPMTSLLKWVDHPKEVPFVGFWPIARPKAFLFSVEPMASPRAASPQEVVWIFCKEFFSFFWVNSCKQHLPFTIYPHLGGLGRFDKGKG